jgi:hypothetical protein
MQRSTPAWSPFDSADPRITKATQDAPPPALRSGR